LGLPHRLQLITGLTNGVALTDFRLRPFLLSSCTNNKGSCAIHADGQAGFQSITMKLF
jgi:hypothetical protein